ADESIAGPVERTAPFGTAALGDAIAREDAETIERLVDVNGDLVGAAGEEPLGAVRNQDPARRRDRARRRALLLGDRQVRSLEPEDQRTLARGSVRDRVGKEDRRRGGGAAGGHRPEHLRDGDRTGR